MDRFTRRAELPFGQYIHAIRYSGRTDEHPDGALRTACGRTQDLSFVLAPTDHGDDAPVTCPECARTLGGDP